MFLLWPKAERKEVSDKRESAVIWYRSQVCEWNQTESHRVGLCVNSTYPAVDRRLDIKNMSTKAQATLRMMSDTSDHTDCTWANTSASTATNRLWRRCTPTNQFLHRFLDKPDFPQLRFRDEQLCGGKLQSEHQLNWSRVRTHVLPEEEGQDGSSQLGEEDEEDEHEELRNRK